MAWLLLAGLGHVVALAAARVSSGRLRAVDEGGRCLPKTDLSLSERIRHGKQCSHDGHDSGFHETGFKSWPHGA